MIEDMQCERCGTMEDVQFDENGNELCFDCIFEMESMNETY